MSNDSTPTFVEILALDVRPYRFGLWCAVAGGEPHANPIVGVRWAEDGESIWFMLDSHNFYEAKPDEVLRLVPLGDFWTERPADKSAAELQRPMPASKCAHCDGTGVDTVARAAHRGGPK